MPIFNSEKTIKKAIETILNQSFIDFELIISDNASTDLTMLICKSFAAEDKRIIYSRQLKNIGAALNFEYVLKKARGKYFLWAAGDDIRTPDFFEENIKFLENNLDYAASCSPNCSSDEKKIIDFEITGSPEERFKYFLNFCWQSHAIFYSIFRRSYMQDCNISEKTFFGADWAINLHLLKKGNFHRASKGLLTLGSNGVSKSIDPWAVFRNSPVELIFPFYRLNKFIVKEITTFSNREKFLIYLKLIKLHLSVIHMPLKSFILENFNVQHSKKKKLI